MRIQENTILDLIHRKRTIVLALACLVLAVTAAQGQLPYIATSQNHFCAGSTDGITMYCNVLAFDPSTDVADWSFAWEPALEVSDPTAQIITTTPGVTTDFSVIMTAPDGTVYTDEITITVFPVFSVDAGPDVAACSTLAEYLSASVDVTDPVDWLWEPALGLSNSTISNPQVLQEVTQLYTVTAVISASTAFSSGDACEASDEVEVISIFPTMDLGSDILACSGTEVILDPGLPVNYTYEWSVAGETLPILSVLSSGSYGLNAISPEGCEQSDVIEVTFTEGPELALPESVEGCENPGILLDATPTNTGTGPFQFAWSNGANQAVITVNQSGVYDVLVSDAGNCSVAGTVLVETLPSPNIVLPADTSLCFDDYPEVSYQLAVPAGFASYSWTTGQSSNVIAIEESGLYGVVVTNDIGCSNEEMSLVRGFCSEPALFVPTAFTPDGDGLNETLRIEGKNLIELDFRLYNRWGALVWQADTIGDYWHGQAPQRTHYVQDDLYIWQAKYRHYLDANGQLSPYTEASGSVRILR